MKINFWEITLILVKKKAKIALFNFNLFFLNLPLHKENLKVSYKKEKKGTWYEKNCYKDLTGTIMKKFKRWFSTRKKAIEWEEQFKLQ